MQERKFKSLGLDVPFQVPESTEEFDRLAKQEGACLTEAVNNVVYRSNLATFRHYFLHGTEGAKDSEGNPLPQINGVEQLTGIKRATETKELTSKNEDGSPKTTEVYAETEMKYFQRVLDERGEEASQYQELANDVANVIPFDPSAQERGSGKTKIPKTYLELAKKAIDGGKAEVLAERLKERLGREVDLDEQSLALAVKEDMDRTRKEQEQRLFGVLTQ